MIKERAFKSNNMSILAMEVSQLQEQVNERMSGTIELYGDPELKRQELDKDTKYLEEIKS